MTKKLFYFQFMIFLPLLSVNAYGDAEDQLSSERPFSIEDLQDYIRQEETFDMLPYLQACGGQIYSKCNDQGRDSAATPLFDTASGRTIIDRALEGIASFFGNDSQKTDEGSQDPKNLKLPINQKTILNHALRVGYAQNKKVLLITGFDSCPPCQELDILMQDSDFKKIADDHFILVKSNYHVSSGRRFPEFNISPFGAPTGFIGSVGLDAESGSYTFENVMIMPTRYLGLDPSELAQTFLNYSTDAKDLPHLSDFKTLKMDLKSIRSIEIQDLISIAEINREELDVRVLQGFNSEISIWINKGFGAFYADHSAAAVGSFLKALHLNERASNEDPDLKEYFEVWAELGIALVLHSGGYSFYGVEPEDFYTRLRGYVAYKLTQLSPEMTVNPWLLKDLHFLSLLGQSIQFDLIQSREIQSDESALNQSYIESVRQLLSKEGNIEKKGLVFSYLIGEMAKEVEESEIAQSLMPFFEELRQSKIARLRNARFKGRFLKELVPALQLTEELLAENGEMNLLALESFKLHLLAQMGRWRELDQQLSGVQSSIEERREQYAQISEAVGWQMGSSLFFIEGQVDDLKMLSALLQGQTIDLSGPRASFNLMSNLSLLKLAIVTENKEQRDEIVSILDQVDISWMQDDFQSRFKVLKNEIVINEREAALNHKYVESFWIDQGSTSEFYEKLKLIAAIENDAKKRNERVLDLIDQIGSGHDFIVRSGSVSVDRFFELLRLRRLAMILNIEEVVAAIDRMVAEIREGKRE